VEVVVAVDMIGIAAEEDKILVAVEHNYLPVGLKHLQSEILDH
jgi:hypothetical protein